MHQNGGFEGNGQTLRIVCRLGEFSDHHGLDLTRRTLLGLLKYPATHSQVANYEKLQNHSDDSPSKLSLYGPPKCIHDDDADLLEWILQPFSASDKAILSEIKTKPGGHAKPVGNLRRLRAGLRKHGWQDNGNFAARRWLKQPEM